MSVQTAAPAPTPSQPSPISTRPHRHSRPLPAAVWLLWMAGAGAFLLILLSLTYCLAFLPVLLSAGEPGFRWDYNAHTRRMTVTAVEPGSPAAAAGLQAGMQIRAILGQEPSPSLDTWGPPGHRVLRPGDPLILAVARGDREGLLGWRLAARPWRRVDMAPGGWTLGEDQLFHTCFLVAALVTLLLGASILKRKPHLPAARAFAGFCWALAMADQTAVIAHAPDEIVPPWLLHTVFANDGWSRLALAAAILFFALFPEPKSFYRRRPHRFVALLFGPATLLLLVHGTLAHSGWRFQPLTISPARLAALRLLDAWDWWAYTVPCTAILIALLIVSYRRAQPGAPRRQMRSLALAGTPFLLYALITMSLFLMRGSVGVRVAMVAPLLSLALPLALGYSILTQGIFDLGQAVRGGLAYAGAMGLVMLAVFVIAGLLGQQIVRSFGPTATGWALAGGALLAHPVLGSAQRRLNRRFGRDSHAALQQLESLSRDLAMVLDAEPLASILTERVPALLGVRRAVLYSRVGETAEFVPLRSVGMEMPRRSLRAPDSALSQRLTRGEPVSIYLPTEDARRLALTPQDEAWLKETELVLWLPLVARGEPRLALALGWKHGQDVYTREELAVLSVLTSQAAAGWENARLARDRAAAARVEQELTIGREIQAQLLPSAPVELGEYRIDAHSEPAAEVGGDFYNFFPVGGGRWAVLLGDVAGKGIPGALCMAVISSLVEGLSEAAPAEGPLSPAELLARANSRAHPKLRPLRMFATALIALIDTTEGAITLANAGQTPPILWRAGQEPEFLRIGGLPLGARPQTDYTEQRLPLRRGDLWILATDGLLNQADPNGYPNLLRRLREASRRSPQAVMNAMFAVDEIPERDDRTIVLISRRAFGDDS
jgi:serine phosphatase RsbU (regulator of sigma subunit)